MKKRVSFWNLLFQPPMLPLYEKLFKKERPSKQPEEEQKTVAIKLDDELFRFASHSEDKWTLRDAVRGVIVTGGIGSGKTSGSGKTISSSFLKKGMGGLVLCVKADEALEWEELVRKSGREKDLIRIKAGSNHAFNFLNWEQKRSACSGGGLVINITNFFMEIIAVIDRANSGKADDGFWDRTLRELLSNTIVIASKLSENLSLETMLEVVEKSPQGPGSDNLKKQPETRSPFDDLCEKARSACPEDEMETLERSIFYFTHKFSVLADKTRSIIVASLSSMADPLLREPLKSLFCGKTTVCPEDALGGKILVIDLPVHSFQLVGRIANTIWKASFKRACQERIRPKVPVFLWIDECQYLIDPTDGMFQTTARSSLCCSVFLTQTISSLYSEFSSKSKVDALMSCLHTKVFHQNGDEATNAWASRTIQKLPLPVSSESRPKHEIVPSLHKRSLTERWEWEDDVPARIFLNLKSGGPENKFQVEGIVLYPGKKFSNGKPWIKAIFDQKA